MEKTCVKKTFATDDFENYRKPTCKERFLKEMEQVILWKELTEVIKPFYPAPRDGGRKPIGIERMLRIYFLQHWFHFSDPRSRRGVL